MMLETNNSPLSNDVDSDKMVTWERRVLIRRKPVVDGRQMTNHKNHHTRLIGILANYGSCLQFMEYFSLVLRRAIAPISRNKT
jgi:hypothetical protein